MPKMLTLRAAAKETGLSYGCLRRWILSGHFTFYVKTGNRYLINLDRLNDFLDKERGDKE